MSVILCVRLNFFKRQPSITKAATYGVVFLGIFCIWYSSNKNAHCNFRKGKRKS